VDKHYLSKSEDVEFFPDSMKALKIFQELGYELFIVTNQSGVGRGYFSFESVYEVHKEIQNQMRMAGLEPFKDFAICPHSPDDSCECRKPSGKMILDLIQKYSLNAEKSYMLGDKTIDPESGLAAGVQGILVRKPKKSDFPYFETLLDFAKSLEK